MPIAAIIGLISCALGTFIACLNLYFSFIRYPVHRWRGGTRNDYRWVSGIPAVGSILLWLGARLLVGRPALMWTAIGISLIDTGGLPCFVATMLYMSLSGRRTGGR